MHNIRIAQARCYVFNFFQNPALGVGAPNSPREFEAIISQTVADGVRFWVAHIDEIIHESNDSAESGPLPPIRFVEQFYVFPIPDVPAGEDEEAFLQQELVEGMAQAMFEEAAILRASARDDN